MRRYDKGGFNAFAVFVAVNGAGAFVPELGSGAISSGGHGRVAVRP